MESNWKRIKEVKIWEPPYQNEPKHEVVWFWLSRDTAILSDEHLALNLPTQNLAKNLSAEQDYEIATISNRQSVKISELYNNNEQNFDQGISMEIWG